MPRRARLSAVIGMIGLAAAPAAPRVWTFEDDPPGTPPRGFTVASGAWSVVSLPDGGKALAQTAMSPDKVFNVILASGTRARDLDLSVRLRAVEGNDDQGGGLVWRARDGRNYYTARFNPLEDNFRVYHVVDGVRTELQSADVKRSPGWHTLRVRMSGDHMTCDLDGKPLLDARDSTIKEAGMIGLWSKADARTQFDDLKMEVVHD
jgi:hypothetical protein